MPIQDAVARLRQFRIFEDFDPDDILALVDNFVEEVRHPAGTVLFRQGNPPDLFYLIEEGEVLEIGRDTAGRVVLRRRAEARDTVGRQALLDHTPYRSTATVTRDAHFLVIDRANFETLLAMFPVLRQRLQRVQIVNRLLAIPLFSSFPQDQLFHVADLIREVEFPAGAIIFSQGEPADAFYVIDTGQVIETIEGRAPGTQAWPKYLSAGSFFGRYEFLHDTVRRATARAVSRVDLFRLNQDAFLWLRQLQPEFERALKRPDALGYLRRTTVFSRLSEDELKQLCGYVGLAHLRAGDILYRQGEIDPTFYVLYDGEAIIRVRDEQNRERPRDYLEAGEAVGETSLFLAEPRDVTIESTTDTTWFYLTRQDLAQFLAQRREIQSKLVLSERVWSRRKLRHFDWLEPEERVVLLRRRHWFFVVRRLVSPVLVWLITIVALALNLPPALESFLRTVDLFVFALAALWIIWRTVDWLNDYYVVTTKRGVHREKVLLIRETRDETPLDMVQNVNINQGLVGNALGFGDLVIDTAAAAGVTRVTFDHVPKPESVQSLILEQTRRVRAGQYLQTRRAIRDKLEATMGVGIRPTVPRPAVPSISAGRPVPSRGGWQERVPRPRLPKLFWIELRMEDRVIWRKHWIRLLQRIWLPLLTVLGVLVLLWLYVAGVEPEQPLIILLLMGLLFPAMGWCWWIGVDWGNDQYIVTDDRIIDTERLPLGFRSRRTETTFDKIQNVSFDIPNPVATLLNYGTVFIYTAGAEGRLDFQWVRDPRKVQAEIFRRLTAYEERQRWQQREERWADLPEWFATYEAMRRK